LQQAQAGSDHLDRFAEEGLGSGDVAPGAQSEIECPPNPINSAV
jgi:hypothetical protein